MYNVMIAFVAHVIRYAFSRMIHGWALFVSQRRTGWCPPGREHSRALLGAAQRNESNAPRLWLGIQVKPGRYSVSLHCH